MTAQSLKIATWNILGRRQHRTDEIAPDGAVESILKQHDVDVLCLQEVHFYDDRPDQQLVAELESVGLRHFVGSPLSESHLDSRARLGVGVASRQEIAHADTYLLTNPRLRASVRGQDWVLHNKGMIGCVLDAADGRKLQVYSLHLFPFFEFGVGEDDDRVDRMWSEFWRYADQLVSSGKLILAGDFNHQRRVQAADRWSRRRWRFLFHDVGTTAKGLALDEIALSWSPHQSETTLVPTFSDHHLVIVEVQI